MSMIPVTLLTGFLGSGKSTLLSKVLRDPAFENSAVIVNEFGEVGLDDFLVAHSEEQTVEMTTGCLCCTVRGDITETLLDLFTRREKGEIKAFDRVIVETTGLADPAPVVHTLISEPRVMQHFDLGGIITTCDALNSLATLEKQIECVKQVAVADRVILTKTDLLAQGDKLEELVARLEQINPTAQHLIAQQDGFDVARLFDMTRFDVGDKAQNVQEWLNSEKLDHDHDHDHHHHDHHGHHHHHHDVNKHGDGIETFSIVIDDPVASVAFINAFRLLIQNQGADLLRIKGIVCLKERLETPFIIHGVQHVFHEPFQLDAWPSDDHRTKLVFITRNITKDVIVSFLDAWLPVEEEVVL